MRMTTQGARTAKYICLARFAINTIVDGWLLVVVYIEYVRRCSSIDPIYIPGRFPACAATSHEKADATSPFYHCSECVYAFVYIIYGWGADHRTVVMVAVAYVFPAPCAAVEVWPSISAAHIFFLHLQITYLYYAYPPMWCSIYSWASHARPDRMRCAD